MTIPVIPAVAAAIKGFTAVMAIKNIAQGNYLGALMSGLAMFGGAALSGLGEVGGVAGAAGATTAATDVLGQMGSIAPIGEMSTLASSVAPALTGTTEALTSMAAPISGVASTLPAAAPGFLESITGAVGDVGEMITKPFEGAIGGLKDVGGGQLADTAGSIYDKAGNLLSSGGGGIGGVVKPLFSAYTADRAAKQQIEAGEEASAQARADAERKRAMRWSRPSEVTNITGLQSRGVLGGQA